MDAFGKPCGRRIAGVTNVTTLKFVSNLKTAIAVDVGIARNSNKCKIQTGGPELRKKCRAQKYAE